MTVLCISTYFKGVAFLQKMKELGNEVLLLTHKKLEEKEWPHESIDQFYYLDEVNNTFQVYQTILSGVAHIMRSNKIDWVVALDDFDVEKAALVREHFRIPGMGQSTARFFRDKLAMRVQAREFGLQVPAFTPVFHDQDITDFLNSTDAPWILKPRSEASATGIKKVNTFQEAWDAIHALGEKRDQYLLEKFTPGDVYHVDTVVFDGQVQFTNVSKYLNTPFEVAHGGGIFRSINLPFESKERKELEEFNKRVLSTFGMRYSATHTEFIKAHDGSGFYFLETASRVGGAHLAEKIEFATGINLWSEWAEVENAVLKKEPFKKLKSNKGYAGILITLSNQEYPDHAIFNEPEVVWNISEPFHVGVIVKSNSSERVLELLDTYANRIFEYNLHASAPAPDSSTH